MTNQPSELEEIFKHLDSWYNDGYDNGGISPQEAIKQILALVSTSQREAEVNRLEVIDHTPNGTGRDYTKWIDKPFKIEFSYQDDGRTLKLFLTDSKEV